MYSVLVLSVFLARNQRFEGTSVFVERVWSGVGQGRAATSRPSAGSTRTAAASSPRGSLRTTTTTWGSTAGLPIKQYMIRDCIYRAVYDAELHAMQYTKRNCI